MKLVCIVILVSIHSGVALAQLAGGPYVIESLDINGGGTTSVGGPYSISASTGQAGGVGTITAVPVPAPPLYQLDDGFWSRTALDCNGNGIPDENDIANCTPGDVTCTDCNGNGLIDMCEGLGSTLSPEAQVMTKDRYISFVSAGGGVSAIRVSLASLHHPDPPNLPQFPSHDFHAAECLHRWVGAPSNCTESEVQHTTFKCATLQCAPAYVDWDAALNGASLHVTGAEVVPSSVYLVQSIPSGADILDESAYSTPLVIPTARWGDVVGPFQAPTPAALTQPNVLDIAAIVDKFKDVPTAIIKARSQLQPQLPDPTRPVDIRDVASTVDAFKNLAYPFTIPPSCP